MHRDEIEDLRSEVRALRTLLADRDAERTKLRQQALALRTVISNIPYAVWWKDRDSTFLGCNDRLASMAGKANPRDIVGLSDYDLPWKKSESDAYRQDDRAVMTSGTAKIDIEETLLAADGAATVILTSKIPLRDDDGNIFGILGTCADITAQKRILQDLELAKEVAEDANRAKSELIANVSHELRTPLALVLGPHESLRQRTDLPADARCDIERIQRNAWRLKQQVDDILDFSKAEAGKVIPIVEPIQVAPTLRALVEDVLPAAESRGIELRFESTADVHAVRADRRMLEKIVLNLVGNALKFTAQGGVVALSVGLNDSHVEVSVRDTGIGIAAADLTRLFQRFQQVDASSRRRFEGTGLGLAIVRELVKLMDGSVGVESELGVGSRFWFRLPVAHAHEVANDAAGEAARGPAYEEENARRAALLLHDEPRIRAKGGDDASRRDLPRIVLAEDNADMRSYITSLLDDDYNVTPCSSGAHALEEIRRESPAVVVSDIMMPGMDGRELLSTLKADAELAHVPVILLTAQVGADVLASSLEGGADDFLGKPFDPSELRARVAVAVRLHDAHHALVDRNRELVQTRDMLVEAEKLAALGRLLAQLSHEINNPMCIVQGNLALLDEHVATIGKALGAYREVETQLDEATRARFEMVRADLDVDATFEDLAIAVRDIGEGVERVNGIQRDLRAFLRGGGAEMQEGDLNEAVRVTIDVLRRGVSKELAITTELGALPRMRFHAGQIKQVLLNVLKNAADALGKTGAIDVKTIAGPHGATITITDSGPGVPEHVRGRIFEPFFSTKDVAHGSGLGLSVSRQIVMAHGGSLRLDDGHRGGARFVIELPWEANPPSLAERDREG